MQISYLPMTFPLLQVSNDKVMTRVVGDDVNPRLTSTISILMLPVPRDGFDPICIKCVGQVYDVYSEASAIRIQPRGPAHSRKVNTPDSLQHSSGQGSPYLFLVDREP